MEHESFFKAIHTALQFFARYLVGSILIIYAVPKLLAFQFQVQNYIYELPLNKVPDFWMAWAFFARSYYYQMLIGLGEIACGFLLFFRRTKTLGALCSFPIVVNITLVDFAFKVNSAKPVALLLLIGVLYLLASDSPKLKAFFWDQQIGASSSRAVIGNILYAVAVLGLSFGLLKYLKTSEFPGEGVYRMESYSTNGVPQALSGGEYVREPRLFLEFASTSFLSLNGRDTRGRYSFNPNQHEFTWVPDNIHPESIIKATYQLSDDGLVLRGRQGADDVAIVLKRVK